MADQVHFSVLMYVTTRSLNLAVAGAFFGVKQIAHEEMSSLITLDWKTSHD